MNEGIDFLKSLGAKIIDSEKKAIDELSAWGAIDESVIDFEKKDLNPNLWDGKKLREKVKDQIWDAIKNATDLNEDDVTAVMLEGSNLTYYYNRYADIDIHLYIKDLSEEDRDKLESKIYDFNKKETFIEGTKNNLELYIMEEEQYKKLVGPRYDLKKGEWLANPTKVDVPTDMYQAAVEISLTFARDLDLAIGEIKRDIIEYIALTEEIEDMLHVDVNQFKEKKKGKLREIKADLEALATKEQILKDLRRKAFSADYEPEEETLYHIKIGDTDRSYTLYNMIFKILQRFGYIDPLKFIKYDIYKKALENKDFDEKSEYYLKRIIKALGLFNQINLEDELE
jgi:hypothetical protein